MPDRLEPGSGPTGALSRMIPAQEMRLFIRRLGQLCGLLVGLVALGTVGFVVTEDVSAWDGFVWTLDTIATVGSVPSPSDTGGQVLKVVLIVLGVGTLFYALVTVTEFFVAGHLSGLLTERRLRRMTRNLSDHYLICGFGRVGQQVARDLQAAGARLVVIDANPEIREAADEMDVPLIEGSSSDDDVLRWTAHDDEFSSHDRSRASGRADCRGKESPISSSMVNFIAIIVRRSGAISLKPC